MKSNYKTLGQYIQLVVGRNNDLGDLPLMGLSIQKKFIRSIANTIGTDMSTYRIIEKNQFAYSPVTSRNGEKITIALFKDYEKAIISQAYTPFEVKDKNKLDPEYLMMWFCRPEFDRYARFMSHGSAREIFGWEEMCETLLPVPHIDTQRQIVAEYNVIQNRIALNQQLIQKLEDTAQTIYKQWFVDFEFPDDNGKPYLSNGGAMVWNETLQKEIPLGWETKKLEKITKMKYGKMLDSELFLEKGYPVFSGYGLRGYYSEYMYEEPQILVLCRGVSGTGEVRLSPRFAFITNLSIVVEINSPSISKMYLYYYLKNSDLKSLDSGSAQSMITSGDLYFQDALVPPKKLQTQFDKFVNIIINKIEIKNKENEKLAELKDLLLSKLATI
jgi:type I restriction enzyme, S subunit